MNVYTPATGEDSAYYTHYRYFTRESQNLQYQIHIRTYFLYRLHGNDLRNLVIIIIFSVKWPIKVGILKKKKKFLKNRLTKRGQMGIILMLVEPLV